MIKWILSLVLGTCLANASDMNFYDFKVKDIDGKIVDLAKYKGKTLLVVNTASQCGYTPQYDGLEKLYNEYHAQNFEVLGFPSNDFGGQEPGSDKEIKAFCTQRYKVTFPMFSKGPVRGEKKQELFHFLTDHAPQKGEIKWNFEKFLIAPDGAVVGRFGSSVTPDSPELKTSLAKILKK